MAHLSQEERPKRTHTARRTSRELAERSLEEKSLPAGMALLCSLWACKDSHTPPFGGKLCDLFSFLLSELSLILFCKLAALPEIINDA